MNPQQPLFFPPEDLHLSPQTSMGMFPPPPMAIPDRYLMDMYLDFDGSAASVHSGMGPMDDFPTPPLSDESFDDGFKPFPDVIPTTELPERCSKDHDCMNLGITALQNLYGVAELAQSTLSADRILDRNRKAIDAISQLVDCECSADPELALLLSLIISKVLRTYRTVTAQRSSSCSSSSSVSGSSQESLFNQGDMDAAFTLGSYRLDEEDEESIKMQLILRQLKRMGSLVDRFVDVYSRQRMHGSHISGALTTFVRGEFKASLKESTDRLSSSMQELF
ncbi:hypothetical protein P152DRAFT_457837 [Eremomyces bilateralis CBS 781.70]|uniref:Aflatoxin regulatory protein domain-containing protein n=1 Tax=Eremomyces bilateralis CBS 781.70 TaxID=1392243 RepID=A0A6G1G5U6_9PEZI|nr:uncharacterized protein P152DRAFT_457837 [Eremomyces bilateralis CBS 781.70]KAF1813475.1 hypothetical protein P152DRAFT_457837 [Eremomyces bilateralis CBS 781.70]